MRIAMSNTFAKTIRQATPSNSLISYSNQSPLSKLFKGNFKALASCRFTLEKGEVFRVPSACREIHVLSGIAWITVAGKDIILNTGEKISLESKKDSAILSVLGNEPLNLEVQGVS
jgi:quercetin dioxygenase-like cupin family protein